MIVAHSRRGAAETRKQTETSYPGDPMQAITVCNAINLNDVYLDPGLFMPREMVRLRAKDH